MIGKSWCMTCNFMTYGKCHPASAARAKTSSDIVGGGDYRRGSLVILPIGSGLSIASGQTTYVNASPQVPLRPRRLVVAPEIADDFSILDIKIGIMSQFAAYGEVSASVFAPHVDPAKDGRSTEVNNLLGLSDILAGQVLILTIRNKNNCVRNFSAVLYADVIDFRRDS